jgi:hypothetical protein
MSKTTKKEIANLTKMKLNELQAKFAEVTGETTRSPNKTFLIRRITETIQAAAFGSKAEKAPEAAAPDAETEATAQPEPAAAGGKLTRLEVPELQARYLEVIGRPTGSTNKPYIIWKIREAQKGRIPLGPRKNAHREGVTFKVLPLRMESAVVDKLDEAWRSRGIKKPDGVLPRSTVPLPQTARGRRSGCAVCGRHRQVSAARSNAPNQGEIRQLRERDHPI